MSKLSIAIVGPGALGSALALALSGCGFSVIELVARANRESLARARPIARKVGAAVSSIERAALTADLVWMCVPDDSISEVASSLRHRHWRGKIALHASGAMPAKALAPLKEAGATIGSAHPMMSFVRNSVADFHDVWFALEGDRRALKTARKLTAELGASSFTISTQAKPLYHAFGAFLSPFLVTMLSAAEEIARNAGIPKQHAPKIMRPIIEKTLRNYFSQGAAASFSGPLIRGDVETIRHHLRALAKLPERELYAALVREATRTLPVKRTKEVLAALD